MGCLRGIQRAEETSVGPWFLNHASQTPRLRPVCEPPRHQHAQRPGLRDYPGAAAACRQDRGHHRMRRPGCQRASRMRRTRGWWTGATMSPPPWRTGGRGTSGRRTRSGRRPHPGGPPDLRSREDRHDLSVLGPQGVRVFEKQGAVREAGGQSEKGGSPPDPISTPIDMSSFLDYRYDKRG